ncbi:MAG: MFS transporter permease [Limnothrix sp.]
MTTASASKGIVWGRVVAIAAVQSALTLMWVAYRAYLGDLLGAWGFSEGFTLKLLTFEVVLALIMEPIFGLLSDRQQRNLGSRAPLITLGVILSSAIFVIFPLVAALQLPVRWVLPFVAIAWALAMTMFRTPIYVLLLKSAPAAELPLAISVLTMTGGLMGLVKGNIKEILLGWGAFPAFLVGSIALLAASTFLRFFMPPLQPPPENQPNVTPSLPWDGVIRTVFMAIALAWGTAIFMGNFTGAFSGGVFGTEQPWMPRLNLFLALAAVPVGWLWIKLRPYPLLAIALCSLTLILTLLLAAPNIAWLYIMMALVWILAFAVMQNGTLPYIFATVPGRWAGFGIGVYFGVAGMANNLFPRLFAPENAILPRGVVGVIALAIAALLALLPFLKKKKPEVLSNEV